MVQVFPEQTDDGAAADCGTAGGTTVGGDTSDVTPGDADEAAEAAEAVRVVARRLRRAARADLEPLGVTAAQVRALRVVEAAGGGLRMSDLADRLDIVRRSATSVVDELEASGLVVRRPDPDDRRGVLVDLTDAGGHLLRRVGARRRAAARDLFADLTPDEVATLRGLLDRIS